MGDILIQELQDRTETSSQKRYSSSIIGTL